METKALRVDMPDGSRWDVPVMIVAQNRAEYYKDEFDGDIERSLEEDTLPLFKADSYEIHDWAANNMSWSDVVEFAERVFLDGKTAVDFEDGWANGEYEIIEKGRDKVHKDLF